MLVAERQTSTALCLLAISRLGCLLTFFSFCFVTVTDTMQTEQKSLKGVAAATLLERSSLQGFSGPTRAHAHGNVVVFTE